MSDAVAKIVCLITIRDGAVCLLAHCEVVNKLTIIRLCRTRV